MNFAQSIQNNIANVLQEVNDNLNMVCVEIFKDVVLESPNPATGDYSSGQLINSWYPAQNKFSSDISTTTDDYGADSYNRIYDVRDYKAFLKKDGVVTLTNNHDYAYRVEALGWPKGESSGQWTWNGATKYAMVDKALVKAAAKFL